MWRPLILSALYTGQRLGDLVTLTWSQIDFARKEILFKTEKTSRRHAAATWLRDAGVSESLAMELLGHDSVSVDRSYVHTSPDAMRNALNRLPALS